MKLIMAIIKDDDAFNIMDSLNESGFSVTKLASTGGFLKVGNTTLICGVDDDKVEFVIDIIKREGRSKKQFANAIGASSGNYVQPPIEVTVGGGTIFVVDVDRFEKV